MLLVGESGAVPSSLVGALDRRGLEVVIVRQPPQVMLELASAQDREAAGHLNQNEALSDLSAPKASIDRSSEASVVVVEPQLQPRVGELRAAIDAYYPAVRCWQYHAHGPEGRATLEDLAPAEENMASREQDLVDAAGSDPHTSPSQPNAPADDAGRVKGASERLRSLVVQVDDPRPPDDGPVVSEEELAMLLGVTPSGITDLPSHETQPHHADGPPPEKPADPPATPGERE
ncbi:MAG: hypothetical protein AAGH99_06730 [Planctomycetota bacterium]